MATRINTPIRISTLIKNPSVRAAFERAERDTPTSIVVADKPQPVLAGGAAVRVLELA
jgi:hypothetical protein